MADKNLRGKRPTQADVAKRVGVSQALVSYVLNQKAPIAVPSETQRRILEAIEELGYVPNRTARSLRTRKTHTIASIIPDITNPFYPAFARGIQDVAEQHGYDLIMYNTDGIAAKELKCLRSVRQGRVDGVIIVPFHVGVEDLESLLEINIAVVVLGDIHPPMGNTMLDGLYVDNTGAARTAVSYLIERGHTRIGMIAGQEDTPPRRNRVLGYRQALAQHHIPLDEILIRGGDFKEEGGYQAMQELLKLSPRPTAVFAANDLMATGALLAIREAGLEVPGDIAVIGFDDVPAARLVSPALTTIAQHQEMLGRRAAEMLLERLAGTAPEEGRFEVMPFSLVVRESA